MVQVADRFAQAYPPAAAHLIPDGFVGDGATPGMRGWFPGRKSATDSSLAERVASSLPALVAFVHDAQLQFGVTPLATALVGFSQGAIVALDVRRRTPISSVVSSRSAAAT